MMKLICLVALAFTIAIVVSVTAHRMDGKIRYVSVERGISPERVEELGYVPKLDRRHELKAEFKKTYTQTGVFSWHVAVDTLSFSIVNYPK